MNEKFAARMRDTKVIRDVSTIGDFIQIWCDGHHRDRRRRRVETEGAVLGAYGRRAPLLCEECESHLAYAEKRRAYCPHDPKPFCAHCTTHCYASEERAWQREMMRYAGPRSWRRGHAIDAVRHLLEGRRFNKLARAKARAAKSLTATAPAADFDSTREESL